MGNIPGTNGLASLRGRQHPAQEKSQVHWCDSTTTFCTTKHENPSPATLSVVRWPYVMRLVTRLDCPIKMKMSIMSTLVLVWTIQCDRKEAVNLDQVICILTPWILRRSMMRMVRPVVHDVS